MTSGQVLATSQAQKSFNGGCLINYTPHTHTGNRGLTISPPETGVGALGIDTAIQFSILTVGQGSVQKRIIPDANGRPVKDSRHQLGITTGIVERCSVATPQEFADILDGLADDQALTLGVTQWQRRSIVPKEKLAASVGINAISRSLDYFDWSADGFFPLLLDYDPEPGQPAITWQELWERFTRVMPEFAGAARVVTVSTSSAIYDKATGECIKPASGFHLYVFVRGDVARFLAILKARCWTAGEAFFKLGNPNAQTGTQRALKRFLVDTAVFSPERLVYEAGAKIPASAPFVQRRPAPTVVNGEWVNLDTIPDLTEAQRTEADNLKAAAKAKATGKAIDATVKRIREKSPNLSEKAARKEATRLTRQAERGELSPDHILYLQNGGTLKAGDLGPQHHRLKIQDPAEPDYRGGEYCGMVFCDSPGQWIIKSFAHGGKVYRLQGKAGKAPTGDAQPQQQWQARQRAKDTKLSPFLALAKSLGLPGDNPEREVHDYYAPGQVQPERIVVNALGGISEADTQNILTSKRPQLFDGVTGSGKTQVAADTRKHIDGAKLGLANTVVLCENLATRFDATAVHSRSSVIPTPDVFQDVVLNPEQFYRAAICEDPYQLLVIDECGVVLPRLLSGALGQNQQDKNLAMANRIGHDAPHRFFLQSNPTRTDLAAIEWLTGQSPEVIKIDRQGLPQSSVEVSILEDEHLPDGSTLSGLHTAAAAAIQGAKRGERWLIVAGSKDILKALQRHFRTHKVKATLRDGSYTLAPIAMGFGQNPTEHCSLANITLVSRQAETGVDLQNDFDCVVSLPSVQQSASEAWQQISRARALFDGRCKRLWIHYPTDTTKFLSVDHLDPAWHLARIKAKNRYYLSLLGGTEAYQATMQARLAEMESVMELRAHYEAEHAAGRWFQREYLTAEFSKRAWPLQTISPEPNALGFADFIQESRDKAKDSWSFAISHGKRWLEDYSEDYRKKIEDDTKASFVLDANRTKLALARQFPQSPLESKQWIRANIVDDPSKRYQTRLLGLLFLDNAQKAIDQSGTLLAREMGSHANEYGIISVLRKLEKSDLPMARLAQALYPHRELILSVLLNGRRLIATDGNALALASSLKEMGDTLNQFARAYLEDSQGFDWTETEPMAIVNKFCSKFLGLALIESGQTRVDGAAIRQYAVGYSKDAVFRKVATLEARLEAKRQRLEAKQNTRLEKSMKQRVQPDTLAKLDAEIAGLQAEIRSLEADLATAQKDATEKWGMVSESALTHLEMAKSAAAGWIRRIENLAVAHGVQEFEGVALNLGVDTVISGLSATPPKNCTSPPDGVEPGLWTALMDAVKQAREWATAGQGTLQDALADIKAMALDAIGEMGWQKLEAIA